MAQKRKNEELSEASDHLYYEINMLRALANAMASGMVTQGWLNNALLESFVIHCRGLLDFIYNDKPRKDDIVAQDYFNEGDWQNIRPPITPVLEKAKKRAGKEIAHLTYARLKVTPESKPWEFVEIANEVNSVLTVFLENVSSSKLCSKWKR